MKKLLTEEVFSEKIDYWNFKSKYEVIDDWFLMASPYPIVAITVAYLLFVLKLGPGFMRNRKPFELKNALVLYNIMQVCASIALVRLCLNLVNKVGLFQTVSITDTSDEKLELLSGGYYYFLCKVTELFDTVFFVLRKKGNQITFLHVFHHTIMVWNTWVFLKIEPEFWMIFLGLINSSVHVVMYAYYGLSAFPSLHKYLWWKKYITSMQLIQFVMLIMHLTISLFISESKPSKPTIVYFYSNVLFFIYLFSRFYSKAYSKSDKKIEDINETNPNHANGSGTHKNGAGISKKNASNDYKNGTKHDGFKNGSTVLRSRN